MIKLYTLHYNNYFNRKLKKEDSLQSYLDQEYWTNGHVVNNVSFNPADGVDTTQIVSYNADNDDYCIVAKIENNVETIISRWFIMEAKRTRTNQYLLTLKRDVLVDNYDAIKEDPIFVEKGTLQENDPMICNDEGMKFNHIKTREEIIVSRDFGDGADIPYESVPWLLAYVKKGTLTNHVISIQSDSPTTDTYTLEQVANDLGCTTTQLRNYLRLPNASQPVGKTYGEEVDINFGFVEGNKGLRLHCFENRKTLQDLGPLIYFNDFVFGFTTNAIASLNDIKIVFENISYETNLRDITNTAFNEYMLNWQQINKLKSYLGRKIIVDGNVYKVSSVSSIPEENWLDVPLTNDNAAIDSLTQAVIDLGNTRRYNGLYHISTKPRHIYLELENTTSGNITFDLVVSGQTRNSTANCVCDIIAIPFADVITGNTYNNVFVLDLVFNLTREQLYRIGCKFSETLGAECYDVQIVPYIDIRTQLGCYERSTQQEIDRVCIDMDGMVNGKDYVNIFKGENVVSRAFFLNSANVQTYRNLFIPYDNPKIKSQTDFIRLVSSTGQSIYEMNPSKNGGLSVLNITGTLKPYNTYYKITPNFGFIYGQNFDKDQRGLIIQDKFSLTQISDAWTQYQLQNKNYQEIFNRQLQSLDIQQGIARQEAPIKAIAGTLSGGASGAITGFMGTGSPYGAMAGAAVGMTAGAIGGAIDLANIDKRLKDQRDLTIQNYNYTLGNVQAIPDTITKTDTFNIDSKLIPYVEFYTCSDEERQALERKIEYDGMTVMRIGTLEEFIDRGGFFKGQYIKNLNNTFKGDNHMLESINTELMKGVYL